MLIQTGHGRCPARLFHGLLFRLLAALAFLECSIGFRLGAEEELRPIVDAVSPEDELMLAGLPPVHRGTRMPEVAVAPETPTVTEEWFGHGLPWRKWSRLTGNWGDARVWLEQNGVTPALTYHFDGVSSISGGARHVMAGRGLLDANITLDLEPLLGLEGGTLFAQYYYRHGQNSAAGVGDIHGFSNIDARHLNKLEELWYEQTFWNKQLRLKLGQVDANSEFDFVEAAGEFINATAGYSPTIAFMRTYPEPALSANVFFYPNDHWYVGAGLYGKPVDECDTRDPFMIGEIGHNFLNADKEPVGRIALGGWYQDGPVNRFDGGSADGTGGLFGVAEALVWREEGSGPESPQEISLFAQYGYGDRVLCAAEHHVSLGATWQGLVSSRDDDLIGLRWSCLKLSRASGAGFDADEHNVECFYLLQLTPCLAIKPDLQWIHHPGGLRSAEDAWVGSLRIRTDF